jgi:hypothetical protein
MSARVVPTSSDCFGYTSVSHLHVVGILMLREWRVPTLAILSPVVPQGEFFATSICGRAFYDGKTLPGRPGRTVFFRRIER